MTELQKVEFEILKSVSDVCDKLNIKYFLVCGSALGTVKYQGFIPWDDDIDIGMMREDYEIFCKKAQELLPDYYFLQTYRTDREFPAFYCKIRDCRTTYIEKSVWKRNMNHGVYIDIFPLDGYPKKKTERILFECRKKILGLLLHGVFEPNDNYSWKSNVLWKIERFVGINKRANALVTCLDKLISKWSCEDSELICNHGNWQGKIEYAPKEHYGEGIMMKFEGLDVRIPEKYDEYLTQKYGNWKLELPVEQQVGHHYYEVCDLIKPYTDYV